MNEQFIKMAQAVKDNLNDEQALEIYNKECEAGNTFGVYPMEHFDEAVEGKTPLEILDSVTRDFNTWDKYFSQSDNPLLYKSYKTALQAIEDKDDGFESLGAYMMLNWNKLGIDTDTRKAINNVMTDDFIDWAEDNGITNCIGDYEHMVDLRYFIDIDKFEAVTLAWDTLFDRVKERLILYSEEGQN